MDNPLENPAIKKHMPLILGVTAGAVVLYYFYSRSGSGSTASSPTADYAAALNAQNQYMATAGQQALAAQTESDQNTLATNKLNAQIQATQQQQEIEGVTAIGSAISGIIQAQSELPAAAISAATAQNQAALLGSAQVAAAGLSAVPGTLSAAGQILQATNEPLDQYGAAVENSGALNVLHSFGSNVSSMTQASASVTNNAVNAATQRQANSNSMWSTIGEVATVAALAA